MHNHDNFKCRTDRSNEANIMRYFLYGFVDYSDFEKAIES